MVHVLEGTSVGLAFNAAGRIQQTLDLPPSAFTYLRSHGELDREHINDLGAILERFTDEGDRRAVVRCARGIYWLYGQMFLRSLLFNFIMIVTAVIAAIIAVFTSPLPPLRRYHIVCRWGRFITWLATRLCGIRYHVDGREHLPHKQSAILFANHQSTCETVAFQQIFPPQVWVLKRELLWVPFFGWGLATLQPIAINRGAGRNAVRQIVEQGRQRLDTGRWVVVFPEGTRVAPGHQSGSVWVVRRWLLLIQP